MRMTKKSLSAAVLGASVLFLSACGDKQLPEEVYKDAMSNMERLESFYFTHSNSLSAAQEGIGTFTRGAVQYNDPLEAYLETDLNVIDVKEAVELDLLIEGEDVKVREDEKWEEYDLTEEQIDSTINIMEDMRFFLSYENEFLMKEEDDYYEVSFKGTDERHHALVEKKLESLGVTEALGGLDEKARESIQLDRVEMVAFVDKETKQLTGFDTRFTFTIELAGEIQSFNEQSNARFSDFNKVDGDLEAFMEKKVKEIQKEKMEEQEEEGNNGEAEEMTE